MNCKILAISYLFPNSVNPNHGIFVLNRLKAVEKYCKVMVVNPIPWFPFSSKLSRYKNYNRIPRREVIDGIEVFHPRFLIIPRYFKFLDAITFSLAVVPLVYKLKKQFLFDIIDLHWTYPDLLSGRILSITTKKKQLVTIRGKEALNPESYFIKFLIKQLLIRSDHVISLSKELRDICLTFGVQLQKNSVVINGVETEIFQYLQKNSCRSKLGLQKNERIILTVGSLIYRKGFDRIIKNLPEIIKIYPNTGLYIIGSEGPEGDYRKELNELIIRLNLKKNVHFIGPVINRDLVNWYNSADVFCLSSRGEGSPNVLAEALACGCPSVSTNVGSVPEILSETFMGIITKNSGSHLLEGLKQALRRTYDREKISNCLHQYDWDWCAKQVVSLYKKVLS